MRINIFADDEVLLQDKVLFELVFDHQLVPLRLHQLLLALPAATIPKALDLLGRFQQFNVRFPNVALELLFVLLGPQVDQLLGLPGAGLRGDLRVLDDVLVVQSQLQERVLAQLPEAQQLLFQAVSEVQVGLDEVVFV